MCVCLSNLGALHLSRKLYDEAIEYLDRAAKIAATSADKRFLFQNYAHYFLSKYMSSFSSGNRDDRSALKAAEKWLDETEDCYDQMWDGLKRDIDKIN